MKFHWNKKQINPCPAPEQIWLHANTEKYELACRVSGAEYARCAGDSFAMAELVKKRVENDDFHNQPKTFIVDEENTSTQDVWVDVMPYSASIFARVCPHSPLDNNVKVGLLAPLLYGNAESQTLLEWEYKLPEGVLAEDIELKHKTIGAYLSIDLFHKEEELINIVYKLDDNAIVLDVYQGDYFFCDVGWISYKELLDPDL